MKQQKTFEVWRRYVGNVSPMNHQWRKYRGYCDRDTAEMAMKAKQRQFSSPIFEYEIREKSRHSLRKAPPS